MTPEQAKRELIAAFPAFALADTDLMPPENSDDFRIGFTLGAVYLDCQLYKSLWYLRLRNVALLPSDVDILIHQQPTLAAAIAALRQAVVEQMRVLEVVAPIRTKTKKWGEGDWANEN